jgi:hypothetical protein
MSVLAQILLFAAQELLKAAPMLFAKIAEVFSRKDVSVADLEALRDDIAKQRYHDFVPDSRLPKPEPPTPNPT